MLESAFSIEQLRESVIAVPPLARDASGGCPIENGKIIQFLEAGGIRSLLYGGNAIFYHIRMSEYAKTLTMLAEQSGPETVVVPSIGPAHGFAMDQVDVLRDFNFPTVMLLPSRDVVDQAGIARSVKTIADRLGKPIVLYIKFDRWMDPKMVQALEADGTISWIKYAVVREDPADDDYLREIQQVFPSERIISGIGEQPAIVHLRDFGVAGFHQRLRLRGSGYFNADDESDPQRKLRAGGVPSTVVPAAGRFTQPNQSYPRASPCR